MKILGIIPARYASTRFPGKPLIDIAGKTMIQRVYEQCSKAKRLSKVIVATDDQRIYDHVKSFGGGVIMTSSHHQSGTDRCAEVIKLLQEEKFDVAINIQGDEPFIKPEQIDLLASCFANPDTKIATLVKKIHSADDLKSNTVMKVVFDINKRAIYFSRNAIPYCRGEEISNWINKHTYYKHIGIYAYKTDVLEQLTSLKPSALELTESLEQLRWIENGWPVHIAITDMESISIDTPDDLKKISSFIS